MTETSDEEHSADSILTATEQQLMAKFMAVMTKRDQKLWGQLSALNQNLSTQNTQMCDMFMRVMKKQESLLSGLKLLPKRSSEESEKCTTTTHDTDTPTKNEKTQTRGKALERKQTISELSKRNSIRGEHTHPQKSIEQNVKLSVTAPIAVVQFTEKELLIDIGPIAQEAVGDHHQFNLKIATLSISRWIAEVYDTLSHQTFSGFYSRHISQAEAKVFFTHNMALNFEHMTRWFWRHQPELWREHKHRLLLHFETETAKTLDFMMVKYPQKKKTFISEQYRQAIPVLDRSTDTQFDMVVKTGCFFKYDPQRKDYYRQVKIFLNKLILESRGHYRKFRKIMREVFYIEGGEIKNQIGMKLRESTPLFTKEDIASEGFEIKMPEILRIIVKWIEQLERRVQRIADGSILYGTFSRKDNSMEPEYLTKDLIKALGEMTNREQMAKLTSAGLQLKVRIRSLLSLLPQYLDKYEPYFEHIKPNEVRSGLLSYILSETASNLSINYLTFLIHFLENISVELLKKENLLKPQQKKLEFSFVSFNVADLLRCRCSGTLDQIRAVYENLSNHSSLTIFRVKNRLDTSNRDFLINVRLNNTPMLCEIQLAITDNAADQRDVYLNQFCHFIYELSRAKYGPIGQAVMINTHLTEFAPFFQRSLSRIHDTSNQPPKDIVVERCDEGVIELNNFICRDNRYNFLCSNCLCFKKAHMNYYTHFDNCSSFLACEAVKPGITLDKQRILCVDCVVMTMKDADKELYLIGPVMQQFFQLVEYEEFRRLMSEHSSNEATKHYGFVCLVQRTASKRNAEVMQIEWMNNQLKFVPVFYETSLKKKMLTIDELQNYYVFKWKPEYSVKYKTAQELKRILAERTYLELEEEDILQVIRMISYAYIPILNEASPSKPIAKRDSDREQQRDTSIRSIDSTVPERTVVFASPLMSMETLKNMNKEMLAVCTHSHGSRILILSTTYGTDELKRLNTIGRALTQGELTMMLNATVWNMNERDVGDNSFQVFTEELRTVRKISLQKNKMTRVDFINSPSLVELNLTSNGIKQLKLQSNIFPNLQRLALSNNRIADVESVVHDHLKHLIMRQCGIQAINFNKWDLPLLEELDLGANSLIELDLSDYDLSNLVKLNIEDNSLEYLTLPNNLEHLQQLILKNNHLRTMDLKLHTLTSLRTLELSNWSYSLGQNLLEAVTLPNDLDNLYELYIFNNKLRTIDLSKLRLSKLGNLHLEENRLELIELPWELPELKWLNFAENKLKGLDLSKLKLPKLKFLNIERNRISALRLPRDLPLLEELHLHTNRLTSLDLSSHQLWHLKSVDASTNLLDNVNLGVHLPSLQTINLSRNCLEKIDLRQCEFKALTSIVFEYNFVDELIFSDGAPKAPNLKVVKATYNPFDKIPSNICMQPHCKHFPALEAVECGIAQLEMFGVWILMGFSDVERNELFDITAERLGRPLDFAGIRLCLRVKSKIEERLKFTRDDIIAVVRTLSDQDRIPSVFQQMVREQLQKHSRER